MTCFGEDALRAELVARLDAIRSGHDVVPFMGGLEPVASLSWRPLAPEMEAVLASSPDYGAPMPGAGPVWPQVAADDREVELVVYRARADGRLYLLAPQAGPPA